MRVIIDRFEGEYAICEKGDRSMMNIKKSKLPAGVREGDVLVINQDHIEIDVGETAKRKADAKRLLDNLFKPGTD